MTISVVITTIGRPEALKECLSHLAAQREPVEEVIVVDADPGRSSEDVVGQFGFARYIHFENGVGKMTGSRNTGLREASGDIVAYVDDDANAVPGWATRIRELFVDEHVGAAGGQALLHGQGKTAQGNEQIGAVTSWGEFTGDFEMDTPGPVEVDHLIGCNMAFRRELVAKLGGFHEFFHDACCTYEEVDLALRIKKHGYRIVYCAHATVDHRPAKRVTGDRFNSKYVYGVTRNHFAVLVSRFGLFHLKTLACLFVIAGKMAKPLAKKILMSPGEGLAKTSALIRGIAVGLAGGTASCFRGDKGLIRGDAIGREIQATVTSGDACLDGKETRFASV